MNKKFIEFKGTELHVYREYKRILTVTHSNRFSVITLQADTPLRTPLTELVKPQS